MMVNFLANKGWNLFTNIQFLLEFIVAGLPFLLYLIGILNPKLYEKYNNNYAGSVIGQILKYPILSVYVVILYVLIFFMGSDLSLLLAFVILSGAFITWFYKIGASAFFVMAFLMLVICPLLVLFNYVRPAETASLLAYSFLLIGTVYSFFAKKEEIRVK
jgi:hypothetical protein